MYTVYQVAVVANLPANAEDIWDIGSISGLGWFPEGGHGSPLWYSCLENPMDTRAWWASVCAVAKSRTWLKWLSMHTHTHAIYQIYHNEMLFSQKLLYFTVLTLTFWETGIYLSKSEYRKKIQTMKNNF